MWKNKLLIHKINLTGHKKVHGAYALGFPEDVSHRSVLALEIHSFSEDLLPPCLN